MCSRKAFGDSARIGELGRFWHEKRSQAYEACTVPEWPNMFMLTAPYGLGGRSYLSMVEAATRSYYFDRHGDAPAMRRHLGFEIELRSRFSSLGHYEFT